VSGRRFCCTGIFAARLGLLIRGSELWFAIVKYAGAAYIAWLGVQSLRAKAAGGGGSCEWDGENEWDRGDWRHEWAGCGAAGGARGVRDGVLTNALHPKATLFFVSLFVRS